MPDNGLNGRCVIRRKASPIPDDWEAVHLGDVARINAKSLSEKTPPDYAFRYIDLASVREGRVSIPDQKIVFSEAPSRARRVPSRGDVIMATVRPNLRGFARVRFDPVDHVCSTGFAVITPKSADDGEFLYQTLYGTSVARQLHGMVAGSSYPAVTATEVARLCIGYPTTQAERTRIGNMLRLAEKCVLDTERLVRRKSRFRRALLQRLLQGKRRFAGFDERWKTFRIGEVLTEVNRIVSLKEDLQYRLVSIRRRSGGLFDREVREGRSIGYSRLKTIKAGDFVIARRQVIHGAMAMATPEFDGAYVSDSYATLVPCNPTLIHMPFFNYLSQTPAMYHKAYRCSYGVAIEKMFFNLAWFLDERIAIPPTLDEQKKIADTLSVCDREMDALRRRLKCLKDLQKGLLQGLLTGKIRLKHKEAR